MTVVIHGADNLGLADRVESAFHFDTSLEQQHASPTSPGVASSVPVSGLDPEHDSAAAAWPHRADPTPEGWRFGEQEAAGQGGHPPFQHDLIL
ncbi:hypothetical protein AB8Z38_34545 [Bradyrhizobium sp. LLZ17]|uniref:Uncharacterized protein n=1 Tax=Bradyrhizobium sp. LLZ17 TaxID=3239388 RepID=A0AB39XJB2_9BRAD